MLEDALEGMRGRLVDELARRVALVDPPSPVPAARRARLDRDVTQAIEALRHSGSIASIASSAIADPKRELDEHAIVEAFLLEQAAKEGQRTRATERALAQWRCAADRRCLHEENRRLTMLLDEVNEGAGGAGSRRKNPLLQSARDAEPARAGPHPPRRHPRQE